MATYEERLAAFEKGGRLMFLAGLFFVLAVVASWIFFAVNVRDIKQWVMQPGPAERQAWVQLQQRFPSPSPREERLLDFCRMLIGMPIVMVKVLTIRFLQVFFLFIGFSMLSAVRYDRALIALTREILKSHHKEG